MLTERDERLDMDGAPYQLHFTPGKLQIRDDQHQEVAALDTPYDEDDLEHLTVRQEVTTEAHIVHPDGPTLRLHQEGGQWTLTDLAPQAQPEATPEAPAADEETETAGHQVQEGQEPPPAPPDIAV